MTINIRVSASVPCFYVKTILGEEKRTVIDALAVHGCDFVGGVVIFFQLHDRVLLLLTAGGFSKFHFSFPREYAEA